MNYQDLIKNLAPEFEQILGGFEREVNQLRSGAASPALVEDLKVNCFNQDFPLKQLAVISTEGRRQIVIQPWDSSYLEPILAALNQASWGTSAALNEKNVIRLSLPPMTEEYRQNFLRNLSEKMEEQRISFRRLRDKAWKELQDGRREGLLREDDKFRGKEELDELVKKYNEKIEAIVERKKKEILE